MSIRISAMVRNRLAKRNGEFELTQKEQEFLRLCCQDMTYETIARRMGKSTRTVDGYRDILFELLEVRSRTGLVLWCFKSGFLKVSEIPLVTHKKIPRKKSPARSGQATHMRKYKKTKVNRKNR